MQPSPQANDMYPKKVPCSSTAVDSPIMHFQALRREGKRRERVWESREGNPCLGDGKPCSMGMKEGAKYYLMPWCIEEANLLDPVELSYAWLHYHYTVCVHDCIRCITG